MTSAERDEAYRLEMDERRMGRGMAAPLPSARGPVVGTGPRATDLWTNVRWEVRIVSIKGTILTIERRPY